MRPAAAEGSRRTSRGSVHARGSDPGRHGGHRRRRPRAAGARAPDRRAPAAANGEAPRPPRRRPRPDPRLRRRSLLLRFRGDPPLGPRVHASVPSRSWPRASVGFRICSKTGREGVLIEPGTPVELATAIEGLVADPSPCGTARGGSSQPPAGAIRDRCHGTRGRADLRGPGERENGCGARSRLVAECRSSPGASVAERSATASRAGPIASISQTNLFASALMKKADVSKPTSETTRPRERISIRRSPFAWNLRVARTAQPIENARIARNRRGADKTELRERPQVAVV